VLSTWVQAVVLLAAVGSTRQSHLRKAYQLLEQAQAPLVGAVAVRTVAETKYGYEYYRGSDTTGREPNGSRSARTGDPKVGRATDPTR